MPIYLSILVVVVIFLAMAIKILREYERGVIFRLGRVLGRPKGPGLIILIPIIDRMVRVSLRTVVLEVRTTGDSRLSCPWLRSGIPFFRGRPRRLRGN